MATIKRNFASSSELYKTDGHGGSDADIDGTKRFTSDIDLETNGYEGTQIHIRYDASGTTDDLEVYIYASEDGTNYDDIAIFAQTFDNNAGADTEVTIILKDVLHARVGFVRSGSTDTFELTCTHQAWNWTST